MTLQTKVKYCSGRARWCWQEVQALDGYEALWRIRGVACLTCGMLLIPFFVQQYRQTLVRTKSKVNYTALAGCEPVLRTVALLRLPLPQSGAECSRTAPPHAELRTAGNRWRYKFLAVLSATIKNHFVVNFSAYRMKFECWHTILCMEPLCCALRKFALKRKNTTNTI